MCSGNESGYILIIYFKEKRNIHTGEQVEIKSTSVVDKIQIGQTFKSIGTELHTK